MNVYDFDGTVYRGDSTVDFYKFVLKRHPHIALCIPTQLFALLKHKLGICTTKEFKEKFFCFLSRLEDVDAEVSLFWEKNMQKIELWYLEVKNADDLIVSASPEFLLGVPCRLLDIRKPIATLCDKQNGKITGENCKGTEKVNRFLAEYPKEKIECFLSDSVSDLPLARLAKKAYLVHGSKITEWNIERELK